MTMSKLKRVKEELKKLTLSRFETKYHESFWGEYDKVLMTPTFMTVLSRNLLWVLNGFGQKDRYGMFLK